MSSSATRLHNGTLEFHLARIVLQHDRGELSMVDALTQLLVVAQGTDEDVARRIASTVVALTPAQLVWLQQQLHNEHADETCEA